MMLICLRLSVDYSSTCVSYQIELSEIRIVKWLILKTVSFSGISIDRVL